MTNALMPLLEAMYSGRRYQGDGEARRIIRTLVAEVERLQRLPESEGQSSEAITSTETSGFPARQSGSPGVDPLGERQTPCSICGKGFREHGIQSHEYTISLRVK